MEREEERTKGRRDGICVSSKKMLRPPAELMWGRGPSGGGARVRSRVQVPLGPEATLGS